MSIPAQQNPPKGQMSRRDFLANSLLAGLGVAFGGALALNLANRFLAADTTEFTMPSDGTAYFLNVDEINHFIERGRAAGLAPIGSEILAVLAAGYKTQIPFAPNSSNQINKLFAETQLGIEPVPYHAEALRYAEASYEIKQIAIAALGDGSSLAIPVNSADYAAGSIDLATRPLIITGDSFSFGIGVDYDDSYANRLGAGQQVNLAVFGHGTEDQLRRFAKYQGALGTNLAGKTLIHCIHHNDLLNDLVSNFYWQFYNGNPRSYANDFTPRFANLVQAARDHQHQGLAYSALSPAATTAAQRIPISGYEYDPNEARFVPQLNFVGLAENPIICDADMNYFDGTIAELARLNNFEPSAFIDTGDFSTEIKFSYSDGSLAATGYHRFGGFDPLDLSIRRLQAFQTTVRENGGDFIAFRLGTFEDYAYERLDYASALRQTFGALLPADINPNPLRHRFIETASAQGITIYDLSPATIQSAALLAELGKTVYYLSDTHFSPIGHLLTAGLIRKTLKENHPHLLEA